MSLRKLEVGSGLRPTKGYLHMDIKKLPHVEVVGDIRKLPFPDNHFDEILGRWVLEHFAYQEIPSVLKEWRRCLKPNGLLHLITNNGEAHFKAYKNKVINIHELNKMLFGNGNKIEDLHKSFWTSELVDFFFTPLFKRVVIKETWKHREDDGSLKCPGIIIKAYK